MSNSMQSHFNDDEVTRIFNDIGEVTAGMTIEKLRDAWSGTSNVAVDNTNTMRQEIKELHQEFKEFKEFVVRRLINIEEQVVFVRRDHALEEDFEELREAWKAYNDLMEKLKTFKALQDSA